MIEIIKRECILSPLDDYCIFEGKSAKLIDSVLSSGICGRGYSGLPVKDKWTAFREKEGSKEIVCLFSGLCANALAEENSDAVFTGVALTANAFGVTEAWIVSDTEIDVPAECFGVHFNTFKIEHTLTAGEETLVFAGIEGRIPITSPQPPYSVEKGLFGHPTLFHSAEFFAHIPYLLSGTDSDTKLCYISGDGAKEGIYEICLGTRLSEIVSLAGAGDIKAVQTGGICGPILADDRLAIEYDYEAFARAGIAFGDGSVRILGKDRCIARELYLALGEAYRSSCGRCVFCREGLYQMYLLMEDVVKGKANDGALSLIKDLASVIKGNAGCDYGKMTASMVCGVFSAFYDEIEAHTRAKCQALACPGLFTVHILPDKCKGCGKCISRCQISAIEGGEGMIHVINQSSCTQCLECMPCDDGGIVKAGMVKPAGPEHPVPVGTFVQKKKGLQRRTV